MEYLSCTSIKARQYASSTGCFAVISDVGVFAHTPEKPASDQIAYIGMMGFTEIKKAKEGCEFRHIFQKMIEYSLQYVVLLTNAETSS